METIANFLMAGIVPTCAAEGCNYQDFLQLIGNLFQYLLLIAVPLATAVIVWGGIVLVTAGANEGKRSQAKSMIGFAIWGLALALAAWLIIKTIMVGLGVKEPFLPNFFQ
ncbi:MAG TPA: hypothetical protein VJL36_01430 [Candidatus Paceibacterota bacterium]